MNIGWRKANAWLLKTALGILLWFDILLMIWAAKSTSDTFYFLDSLVGGEGSGGDGDTLFVFALLMTLVTLIFCIFIGLRGRNLK